MESRLLGRQSSPNAHSMISGSHYHYVIPVQSREVAKGDFSASLKDRVFEPVTRSLIRGSVAQGIVRSRGTQRPGTTNELNRSRHKLYSISDNERLRHTLTDDLPRVAENGNFKTVASVHRHPLAGLRHRAKPNFQALWPFLSHADLEQLLLAARLSYRPRSHLQETRTGKSVLPSREMHLLTNELLSRV